MQEVDLKGNGRIDYEEFTKVMKSIIQEKLIKVMKVDEMPQEDVYELSSEDQSERSHSQGSIRDEIQDAINDNGNDNRLIAQQKRSVYMSK